MASTLVSMSLAIIFTLWLAPSVSATVIAIEYGSSPVEAALHQMRRPLAGRARRSSTRAVK